MHSSSINPRSARCDGGMLGRSWSERVCGFQRPKSIPPVSGRNVKHLMPDTLDTSSFVKAFGICPRGPKERFSHVERGVPGGRLGSKKRTIYHARCECDPQESHIAPR